jgi:integrase
MAKTSKGHIQQLPSGSFRVKVYAGTDPVTGKARLLRQTCPDEAAAYAALSRMLVEAGGGRFPDQQATLGQALGKYLEVADLEVSTREAHQGYVRRTIGPVLGEVKIRKLGADSLDGAVYGAEEVLPAVRTAAADRALCRRRALVRPAMRPAA